MNSNKKSKGKGSGNHESNNSTDLSVLRPPMTTSVTCFLDVIKAYNNGTDEIRNLLSDECDIIYECKVCRNIFRSLPNFISHKRIFCKQPFNTQLHFHFPPCDDQEIQLLNTKIEKLEASCRREEKHNITNNKDITEHLENIVKRKQLNPQKLASSSAADELRLQSKILQLDNIESSKCAVYQTVKSENGRDDSDNIKLELIEISNHAIKTQTMSNLDANGRVIEESLESDVFECDSCKFKSTTEKMLKLHETTKHDPETTFFKCPSCSKRFLQVSTVMKHLGNEHNKSSRRIRTLREGIYRKRSRIDDTKIAIDPKKVKLSGTKESNSPTPSPPLLQKTLAENFVCTYCGLVFDNNTILMNHENKCVENIGKLRARKAQPSGVYEKKRITLENILKKRLDTLSPINLETISSTNRSKPIDTLKEMSTHIPSPSNCVKSEIKEKLQQLIEGRSIDSVGVIGPPVVALQKRPQRNRIRKNHKDFVYDLPNTSAAIALNQLSRMPRRRNTIQDLLTKTIDDKLPEKLRSATPPAAVISLAAQQHILVKKIRGNAYKIAKQMVSMSKAKFKFNPKGKGTGGGGGGGGVTTTRTIPKPASDPMISITTNSSNPESISATSNPPRMISKTPPFELNATVLPQIDIVTAPPVLFEMDSIPPVMMVVVNDDDIGIASQMKITEVIELKNDDDPDAIERELEQLLVTDNHKKIKNDLDKITIIDMSADEIENDDPIELSPDVDISDMSTTTTPELPVVVIEAENNGVIDVSRDLDDCVIETDNISIENGLINATTTVVSNDLILLHQVPSGEEFKKHLLNYRLTEPIKKILIVAQEAETQPLPRQPLPPSPPQPKTTDTVSATDHC